MMILTAEKYRFFLPIAPELHFEVPPTDLSDIGINLYQYRVSDEEPGMSKTLPEIFWYAPPDRLQVWLNGTSLKANEYQFVAHRLSVSGVKLRDVVLVRYNNSATWHHLSVAEHLIQGASPLSESVQSIDQYQGGYRVNYETLSSARFGDLRRCEAHMGWDYSPPRGFVGIDSFSYRIVTEFGQCSEPACCSIKVGDMRANAGQTS